MRTIPSFPTLPQLRAAIKAGLTIKPAISLSDGEYLAEAGNAHLRVVVEKGVITKWLPTNRDQKQS